MVLRIGARYVDSLNQSEISLRVPLSFDRFVRHRKLCRHYSGLLPGLTPSALRRGLPTPVTLSNRLFVCARTLLPSQSEFGCFGRSKYYPERRFSARN